MQSFNFIVTKSKQSDSGQLYVEGRDELIDEALTVSCTVFLIFARE